MDRGQAEAVHLTTDSLRSSGGYLLLLFLRRDLLAAWSRANAGFMSLQ